jgi:hypothetical protein
MKVTTYRQRKIKEANREIIRFNNLICESKAGSRQAGKLLKRILQIDHLLGLIEKNEDACKHDPSLHRFNKMIDKELSKVLRTERNMLLKLGSLGGTPKTYLTKIKRE